MRFTVQRQALSRWAIWLLVPLCYYAGAKLGVSLAVMPEGIAILWPPNSVLLTAMLLGRPRDIPVIAALGVVAEAVADVPTFTVTEALTFGFANALEATIACLLLRAWRFDARLGTLADLRKFVLAGPAVAAALAAAIGAAVYSHFRGGQTSYLEFLRVWWLGDAMGLLIFTPLLLSAFAGRASAPGDIATAGWRAADAAVVLVGVAMTALMALTGGTVLGTHLAPVLLIPFVVYLATRFDLRVVSLSVAVAGGAVAYATAHGRYPFGVLPPQEASMRAQEFIFTMSLLSLGLGALLGQLRARQRDLRDANERLDQLNRSLESRVAERTAQLDDSNRQLERLAMTDALTGLANRRAFWFAAHNAVGIAQRHDRPLAVVMIDVDHFKAINDAHGHAVGDKVLQHVAATLARAVRGADTLARYGGEEFIVLAPETDLDSALTLARRMGELLRDSALVVEGVALRVTASFGIAAFGGSGDDLDRLMHRADAALYESKCAGRDRATAVAAPGGEPAGSAAPDTVAPR